MENVHLVTRKIWPFSSLSDIPAVSRSSIEATTSAASPTILLSVNKKLFSSPSNFVENNYFWFNIRYLLLKFAFKKLLERTLEPICTPLYIYYRYRYTPTKTIIIFDHFVPSSGKKEFQCNSVYINTDFFSW